MMSSLTKGGGKVPVTRAHLTEQIKAAERSDGTVILRVGPTEVQISKVPDDGYSAEISGRDFGIRLNFDTPEDTADFVVSEIEATPSTAAAPPPVQFYCPRCDTHDSGWHEPASEGCRVAGEEKRRSQSDWNE